ncbi:MAG: hypothetical protein KIPDCIKN_02398 [Haliscomenobacter sp.]|nr:hypothetical protein [Haliscomenobacter sp.]
MPRKNRTPPANNTYFVKIRYKTPGFPNGMDTGTQGVESIQKAPGPLLNGFPALNNPKDDHDDCNDQQNVYKPACAVAYKTYEPSNDENDGNDIKQISHN